MGLNIIWHFKKYNFNNHSFLITIASGSFYRLWSLVLNILLTFLLFLKSLQKWLRTLGQQFSINFARRRHIVLLLVLNHGTRSRGSYSRWCNYWSLLLPLVSTWLQSLIFRRTHLILEIIYTLWNTSTRLIV